MSQGDRRIVTRPPARKASSSFRLLEDWEEFLTKNFHRLPGPARRRWVRLLVRTILRDSIPEQLIATRIYLAIRRAENLQIPAPDDTAALVDWLADRYRSPIRQIAQRHPNAQDNC